MVLNLKKVSLAACCFFSLIIVIFMLIIPPRLYGDGNEYFLMLESLRNHLSPDLQKQDVNDFYNGTTNAFGFKLSPLNGYIKSLDGRYYSIHFWAYSLSNLPVKLLLELFHLDQRKTFQITNSLLFAAALFAIVYYSNLSEKQKLLFILFIIFSPILWFVHWTHPEVFMASLITISLICFAKRKYAAAIILGAVASFQNQALTIYVAFVVLKGALDSKHRLRSLLLYGFLSLLVFVPNIFSYLHYGSFSSLGAVTSIKNLTVKSVYELFFDLNIGLFFYAPLILVSLGIIIYRTLHTFKTRKLAVETQLLLVLLACSAISSTTVNWNHGTSGPLRYTIWMLPMIFYIIVINIELILSSRVLAAFLVIGLLSQMVIISWGGFLVPPVDYLDHSAIAKLVLDNCPSLYGSSSDIFCDRTMHKEVDCENPTVYYKNNEFRKALLTCEGLDKMNAICGCITDNIRARCQGALKGRWFYISYMP